MAPKKLWPYLLGGAALGAGLSALTSSMRKPRVILATRPGMMEAGWGAYIGDLTVSVKVCDGAGPWLTKPAPLVETVRQAGSPLWGWGYHYLSRWRGSDGNFSQRYASDVESAQREAEAAAEASLYWGCEAYCCNAERFAFGTEGAPDPKDPAEAAAAFADRFGQLAPGVKLIWNGYAFVHYQPRKGAPYREGLTREAIRRFDGYMPMVYKKGTDTAARRLQTAATWDKVAEKARDWGVPLMPMTGTGRMGDDGQAWNWFFDRDGAPGLASNVARVRPAGVAFFYGAGSKPMLSQGNSRNPALYRVPPWLRTAYRAGDGFRGTEAYPDWTPGEGGAVA